MRAWWKAPIGGLPIIAVKPLVSFDRDLARGMGLKIGDTITINLIGRDIDLRIFNLRDIDFRTGGINFVLTVSPGEVDKAPHTFLATVRAAPARKRRSSPPCRKLFPM